MNSNPKTTDFNETGKTAETREKLFYEPGYIPYEHSRKAPNVPKPIPKTYSPRPRAKLTQPNSSSKASVKPSPETAEVDLNNPASIYKYLLKNVYKQEEYCKDAAMLLYNHLRGITSRAFICGPSGSGKTYVMECLKKLWPRIVVVNAAKLSKEGWSGGNKVTDFLQRVDAENQDYIIVFDEFDKCAKPQHSSGGDNVSSTIQSEFLKLVEGEIVRIKQDKTEQVFDTSKMSFVFCGSFAEKAKEIAEKESERSFGFTSSAAKHVEAFDRKLNLDDLIDFGVIPELASRSTMISNVRPLTKEDYEYLISDHPGSPIKQLSETYGIELKVSKKKCKEIAEEAFRSGLGVRNATSQIRRMIDENVFASFEQSGDLPEVLEL